MATSETNTEYLISSTLGKHRKIQKSTLSRTFGVRANSRDAMPIESVSYRRIREWNLRFSRQYSFFQRIHFLSTCNIFHCWAKKIIRAEIFERPNDDSFSLCSFPLVRFRKIWVINKKPTRNGILLKILGAWLET